MTRPKVPEDKRQRTAQACDTCKRRKQKVSPHFSHLPSTYLHFYHSITTGILPGKQNASAFQQLPITILFPGLSAKWRL
ncbi:Fungal specific transcription factor domain-containing protein [Colletotrichum higginsianum IMI 349063]|uniref:Fungal specific transcription factor domain-containing protein n=1 Tax=Colletotrichum higginsianum (strain IMI 349063) TaxID=759273 RepID=A0A1B7YQ20_COLHI|nr:Fungal specific transcription factor domain-containing protein [Colletotrichum higginsianum IMI 349063]OBR13988.1 Fungal specific transcription factor domain-containing protein [Colletotrichum higginsianum IMI 349063]